MIFTVKDTEMKSLVFSDKKMKKRTTRMGGKFSKDWRTVTQVVNVRGEEVSCMEVFRGDGGRGSVMLGWKIIIYCCDMTL